MRKHFILLALLFAITITRAQMAPAPGKSEGLTITNIETGLRMMPVGNYSRVKVLTPGQTDADDGILIDCPEIISLTTATGRNDLIYALFNSNYPDIRVKWARRDNQLSFVMDDLPTARLTCTVILEADGAHVKYALTNKSNEAFARAIVSSCNRLRSGFYDVFLERTYVHQKEGFALLAGFIPERTSLPKAKWLPCRVRAAYSIEPPASGVSTGDGGVTLYDNPEKVDIPFLATRSTDGKWVAATCSAINPEQVWSNPELTCHHADGAVKLGPKATATIETKTFIFKGDLPDALAKVSKQRAVWTGK